MFALAQKERIRPIRPLKLLSLSDVGVALACMRSGKHTGKLVVCNGGRAVPVPVQLARSELRLRGERGVPAR
jgi:hypothetical protein